MIGSEAHLAIAAEIADKTVTLVKDTAQNLPITPQTHKRIRLYGISGGADFTRRIPWPTSMSWPRNWSGPVLRCTSSRPRRSARPRGRKA